MATLVPAHLTKNDLHGKTAMLAREAGELGDDFLKYLYIMALRHIEETTGGRGNAD